MNDVVVIGAGAAGMLAAAILSKENLKVTLLEKKHLPGSKLRITGKGRCNITNINPVKDHFENIFPKPKFLKTIYYNFFNNEIRALFSKLGIETKVERGNRVFPISDSAQEVVDKLEEAYKSNGVNYQYNCKVVSITKNESDIFHITDNNGKRYRAKNVIIATGGASYPITGSTGDGQKLAKELGLSVSKLYPGLVPLNTKGDLAQRMQGVSLKNVTASIWQGNKKLFSEFGEMLFTHFGVTGPIILTLSNKIAGLDISSLTLKIDLKPALTHEKLDKRLVDELNSSGKRKFETMLKTLLPNKMIAVCAHELKIPLETLTNQINAKQRKELRIWLKELTLEVNSTRSFKEAIVTVGGVATEELNKKTLESKKIENLYFCGEVIDLHGNTGGYNLQIAWSTAYAASQAIINKK